MILHLNLACSNLYGGREAAEVKFAQLFFIPLHFFFSSFARVPLTGKAAFSCAAVDDAGASGILLDSGADSGH